MTIMECCKCIETKKWNFEGGEMENNGIMTVMECCSFVEWSKNGNEKNDK